MIRYSIPLYKLFQFFFISLKREALICGNDLIICFVCLVSAFPSFEILLCFFWIKIYVALSIHWFRSFSIEIWFSFGWILLYFDFYILLSGRNFCRNLLRVLPVHWYHLFVSIRYHKKIAFSRRNIIQSDGNAIVQNTDLHSRKTNPDWQCNRDLIW